MRWLVLVRHGMGEYTVALKVSLAAEGHVSCAEVAPERPAGQPAPGMSYWTDGRFRLTTETGARLRSRRPPLRRLGGTEVAYRVPGARLADSRLPQYRNDMGEATVEIEVDTLLAEPRAAELQLLLVPQGEQPVPDGEPLAEWPLFDGQPGVWLALVQTADEAA